MKIKLLAFLFTFFLIPGISAFAELHTLKIESSFAAFLIPEIAPSAEWRTLEIEFAFTPPDEPDKYLVGYRLYKQSMQVCETANPNATLITCDILTEDGTFDFTLTAYYSDNIQSPPSPPFQYTIGTTSVTPSPEPPTAILSSSAAAGNAPLAVTFNGTSSMTPNPPIVSYKWTFDDGTQATGETTSHIYTTAGTYHAELTVTDSLGLTATIDTPIIVLGTVIPNGKPEAIISADLTEGDAPMAVTFDGSQSSDPDGSIASYDWNFGDGTTGTGTTVLHTFNDAATYTVSLQVTDNQGETATTTREIICNIAPPENILNFEVGEISIDHQWVRVTIENSFNEPIVIAGPPTTNGNDPVLIRIRNIDQSGFDIRLQEWDYLNDSHVEETFSYIVMEKGIYTLENGTKIEAFSFTGRTGFQKISLQQSYDLTPVILTQIMTENETDAVTDRIRNIGLNSFEYLMQEQETTTTSHTTETIGYIAWEPGEVDLSGLLFEAGISTKNITHDWVDLTYQTKFPDMPLFIADMQTYAGSDTAAVRSQNMSQTNTQIKIEEEQSKDTETNHVAEAVGYLIIGSATAQAEPQTLATGPSPVKQESASSVIVSASGQ